MLLVGTIKTRSLPLSRRVEARPSRSFEARVFARNFGRAAIAPLRLDVHQGVGDEFGVEVINLQLRRWSAISCGGVAPGMRSSPRCVIRATL
jgi:hypothetical protein